MTRQEVADMVEEVGIPTAYYQFTKKTAVPCPFICFFFSESNDLYADNSNYQKIENLVIELYTKEKDFALERTLESVLRSHEMAWSREETPLDSEGMYLEVYNLNVIIEE